MQLYVYLGCVYDKQFGYYSVPAERMKFINEAPAEYEDAMNILRAAAQPKGSWGGLAVIEGVGSYFRATHETFYLQSKEQTNL
jgi:hypothetical protein